MTSRDLIVLGDTTLGAFARELQAHCERARVPWTVRDGGFDSWEREIHDPSSVARRSESTLAFVLSPRVLEGAVATEPLTRVRSALESLATIEPPRTVLFGNLFHDPQRVLPLTEPRALADRAAQANALLDEFSQSHSWFYVIDQASLALEVGVSTLHDARYEALGSLYFSPTGTHQIASLWCRALGALSLTPAKVMAVDLDNVLWGGILGEDGADNLKMSGTGSGLFYRRFQQGLLDLKRSGILLAACSKNNAAEAEAVLRDHPDCLIRPQDFAALEVSWDRKSEGLRRIAARLRLGLDAFVFVDDSPFEREEVRTTLPQVRVLDFPEKPEGLVTMLRSCTAFDRLRVTAEDQMRAKSYADDAQRDALRIGAQTPADFYQSLKLTAKIYRARPDEFERLHQLIHKTNQFNLTGTRQTQDEFRGLLRSPGAEVFAIRVADRFGDSGLVGLAIVNRANPVQWRVENFLLSCRVIGRTVENACVAWLAARAAAAQSETLAFRFAESKRNQVAAEFLARSGLRPNADASEWTISLDQVDSLPSHYVTITG
jgi:FkbH-like protein